MKNQQLDLFNKGNFQEIDNQFMLDGHRALGDIEKLQKQYQKNDMDTLLNELHDSMVGYYLGFSLINIEKHGFDCKFSQNKEIYLESKVASFSSSSWSATFNDTTYEKAAAFGDKKVWLALSIWESASNLLCICFGQNEKIETFLTERIDNFKAGNTVRSTQSISFSKLVLDYDFKILSITKSKEELYTILTLKNKNLRVIDKNNILMLKDFEPQKFFML